MSNQKTFDFLRYLWQGGKLSYYWTAPGLRSQWFGTDNILPIPNVEKNIYFGVHPVNEIPPISTTGKTSKQWIRSQAEYVSAINTLFGEFDFKDFGGNREATLQHINELPYEPSVIVSSGGGLHCYWLLMETFYLDSDEARRRAADIQYRWVDYVGSDDGAKDLARILRVPGTKNFKKEYAPDFPPVEMVKCQLQRTYMLDYLESQLPPPAAEPTPKPQKSADSATLTLDEAKIIDKLTKAANGSKFLDLMNGNTAGYDSQSQADLALCSLIAFYPTDETQIDNIFRQSKLIRDKWDEVHRAKDKATYGEMTIRKALDSSSAGSYDPDYRAPVNGNGTAAVVEVAEVEPTITANVNGTSTGLALEEAKRAAVEVENEAVAQAVEVVETYEIPEHDGEVFAPPLPDNAIIDFDTGKDACPWLDRYVEYSRRWSPWGYEHYHYACGLWALSTINAGRTVLNFGGEIKPMLYALLVGKTSNTAKTQTAEIAENMLYQCGLDFLLAEGEATPQKYINLLSTPLTVKGERSEDWLRRTALEGRRGWLYDEFGHKVDAMMRDGSTMSDFRAHLLKFYNGPEKYQYATVGRGTETVNNPYLALLGCTTPAHIKKHAREDGMLWRDGLWPRFLMVAPPPSFVGEGRFPRNEFREVPASVKNTLMNWSDRLDWNQTTLAPILDDDGETTGESGVYVTEMPKETLTLSHECYEAFYTYLNSLRAIDTHEDMDGVYTRIAHNMLRASMLIASVAGSKAIEPPHMAYAQMLSEQWREGFHRVHSSASNAEQSQEEKLQEKILGHLEAAKGKPIAKRELQRKIYGMTADKLNLILKGLEDLGRIEAVKIGRSPAVVLL